MVQPVGILPRHHSRRSPSLSPLLSQQSVAPRALVQATTSQFQIRRGKCSTSGRSGVGLNSRGRISRHRLPSASPGFTDPRCGGQAGIRRNLKVASRLWNPCIGTRAYHSVSLSPDAGNVAYHRHLEWTGSAQRERSPGRQATRRLASPGRPEGASHSIST